MMVEKSSSDGGNILRYRWNFSKMFLFSFFSLLIGGGFSYVLAITVNFFMVQGAGQEFVSIANLTLVISLLSVSVFFVSFGCLHLIYFLTILWKFFHEGYSISASSDMKRVIDSDGSEFRWDKHAAGKLCQTSSLNGFVVFFDNDSAQECKSFRKNYFKMILSIYFSAMTLSRVPPSALVFPGFFLHGGNDALKIYRNLLLTASVNARGRVLRQ